MAMGGLSRSSNKVASQQQIARILFDCWDPLGVQSIAPADEYDDYARVIAEMLGRGEGESEIRFYLGRTRALVLCAPVDELADEHAAHLVCAAAFD